MDKETFELRQEWAKANLKNLKKEKSSYTEQLRVYNSLLEFAEKDIKMYESILEEKFEEK